MALDPILHESICLLEKNIDDETLSALYLDFESGQDLDALVAKYGESPTQKQLLTKLHEQRTQIERLLEENQHQEEEPSPTTADPEPEEPSPSS